MITLDPTLVSRVAPSVPTGVCAVCATTRPRRALRPFVCEDWTDSRSLLECLDTATCRATVLARGEE